VLRVLLVILLIVKDMAGNRANVRFRSFDAAAAHARTVIIPQVADALENVAIGAVEEGLGQQDSTAYKADVESLCEILRELYQPDRARVVAAVEEWRRLAEDDRAGDTWVEWVE